MIPDEVFSVALPISLFFIMIGVGVTVAPKEFGHVAANPKGVFVGLISQALLMPLFGLSVAILLGLKAELAVGLVLIASCPGGAASNIFVLFAKGNLALSILLTILTSLTTILSLPFFVNLSLEITLNESSDIFLPIDKTIYSIFLVVLLPVVLGMFLKKYFPLFADKLEKSLGALGGVVLIGFIVLLVLDTWDQISVIFSLAGLAVILVTVVSILGGILLCRIFSLSQRESLSIALELTIKNGAIALMVALSILDNKEIALPTIVYSVTMFVFGTILVKFGRAQIRNPKV